MLVSSAENCKFIHMIVSSWSECVATVLIKENAAVARYRPAQGRKAVPCYWWFPSIIQGLQCQPEVVCSIHWVHDNSVQLLRGSRRPWSFLEMVKEQFPSADWPYTCRCCASPPYGILLYLLVEVRCFGHSSRDGVVCCLLNCLFVCFNERWWVWVLWLHGRLFPDQAGQGRQWFRWFAQRNVLNADYIAQTKIRNMRMSSYNLWVVFSVSKSMFNNYGLRANWQKKWEVSWSILNGQFWELLFPVKIIFLS